MAHRKGVKGVKCPELECMTRPPWLMKCASTLVAYFLKDKQGGAVAYTAPAH